MDDRSPTASSDLCKACGLCCDGVLFDYVPVDSNEAGRLSAMGFSLTCGNDGQQRFAHPCPMFRGQCCTVYADRPAPCRAFRCELLKKMEAQEISIDAAMHTVRETRELVDRIWPKLQDCAGGAAGIQWVKLLKRWRAKPPVERSADADARLVLDLTLLNRILDAHFREEAQRHVSEEG